MFCGSKKMSSSVSFDSCEQSVFEDSFSLNCYEKPTIPGNSSSNLIENGLLNVQYPTPKDLTGNTQSSISYDKALSIAKNVPEQSVERFSNDVVDSLTEVKHSFLENCTSGIYSELKRHGIDKDYSECCVGEGKSDGDNYKLVELTSVHNSGPVETNLEVVDEGTVVAILRVKMSRLEGNYKFHCSQCNCTFPCRHSVVSHMTSHTDIKPFHCVLCDSLSSLETEAILHYRSHLRSETLLVKVTQPPDSTTEASNVLASGPLHACVQCEITFKTTESLTAHMEMHLKIDDSLKEQFCPHCGEEFPSPTLLESHKISFHSNSIEVLALDKNESSIMPERKCERKWSCQTCEKAFRSSRALREHEVVHTGARDFPCEICGKAFGTATNMRIHLLTHSDQRPFACQTCGATFRQKDSLKVHERKHSGERPFVCNVCQMTFDRNFTWKNHMLKHAEKSFVCSVCGKAFSTRGGLIDHERRHFKEPAQTDKKHRPRAKSGTGNWVCDECGKMYSTRSNLKAHQKSHKPTQTCHVCPVCSQSYKSRDSMEVHMRRHAEDRPFKCTMCPRTFYRSYTLKLHILTHTGEKPHSCPIEGCKKSFAQTSSLSYHVRNHKKRDEHGQNQSNVKRPYRKRKNIQDNLYREYIDSDINLRSSPMKNNKPSCSSESIAVQDLKLGVDTLVAQSVSSNTDVLTNTSEDTAVQSMLDDISNSMAHHMDTAIPAVWDDSESIAMLGGVNGLHNPSDHPTLGTLNAINMDLQQQHCQQVSLMQFLPAATLPLLGGGPDPPPGTVLYQPDGVHKVLADHSILIPDLP